MPRGLAHYAGAVQLQAVPSVRLGRTVGATYVEAGPGEVDVERGLSAEGEAESRGRACTHLAPMAPLAALRCV